MIGALPGKRLPRTACTWSAFSTDLRGSTSVSNRIRTVSSFPSPAWPGELRLQCSCTLHCVRGVTKSEPPLHHVRVPCPGRGRSVHIVSSDQAGRPTPSPYDPQTLLNSQPVMVAVIDPATYRVQFQNQTGLDRLGNLSGQRCYEGIAKCSAPCNFCRMPEAVASGKLTSNEVRLPDDQYLLVQWTTAPTEDGS